MSNSYFQAWRIIPVIIWLLTGGGFGQSVIWEEDFAGQTGKGTTEGPTTDMVGISKWSIVLHREFPTNAHFMVATNASTHEEYFEGYRLNGECIWKSETIDISTNGPVDLSVQLQETGTMTASDSIGIYYRLNDKGESLFLNNGFFIDDYGSEWLEASQPYVSGSSVQIIVRMVTTDADKHHRIDNIRVAETSILSHTPPDISIDDNETNRFATVGEPVQFVLTATENLLDASNDQITLWAENLPANATFTSTNGLSPLSQTFYWTPGALGEEVIHFFAGDVDGTNQLDITFTVCQLDPGKIWVNEIHYDNDGVDNDEGIEIAGPAGFNLTNYKVYFYNGYDGTCYDELALAEIIDNEAGGFGALWFALSGIQNGAPDGMALVYETSSETNVLQFLSYSGSFLATDGPALGLTAVDIGVAQTSTTPIGETLQLTGRGKAYSDFTWVGPVTDSRGSLNAGQQIFKPGFLLIVR